MRWWYGVLEVGRGVGSGAEVMLLRADARHPCANNGKGAHTPGTRTTELKIIQTNRLAARCIGEQRLYVMHSACQ
eukprot:1319700-Pyramimonas_sp.AAC.1